MGSRSVIYDLHENVDNQDESVNIFGSDDEVSNRNAAKRIKKRIFNIKLTASYFKSKLKYFHIDCY